MLNKNSCRGLDFSAPDHLRAKKTRENSLRTVGKFVNMRCFKLVISALNFSSSTRSLTSTIKTYKIYSLIKFKILNFD